MKTGLKMLCAAMLGLGYVSADLHAQADGGAKLEATILDYTGSSGAKHWTVVWITTESGAFIKSLRKQGPSWTSTSWGSHCKVWNDARGGSAAGSQALDGYSSATAADYSGTNSPIVWTWNCHDANNNLVADGNYKFWVQYAEDAGQGPYTTSGLLWTKGSAAATNTYPDQSVNFKNMRVTWTPTPPLTVAPAITSAAPAAAGTVGVPYSFACTATGTAPITFTATGLPTGLTINSAGAISGTPTEAGVFTGSIVAANGTPPDATQSFSITIGVVPVNVSSVRVDGNSLIMSGSGPVNGTYTVLISININQAMGQWTPIATNSMDGGGTFQFTNALSAEVPLQFYRLRVP